MNDKLYDFLYNKGQMTDSSECGSVIECLISGLEGLDDDNESHTVADDLDHLDCMLDQFEDWAKSLKEDLAEYRKKHVRVKKVKP